MKFDMSGGAAVIEAVAAIALLELPVRVIAVVGAKYTLVILSISQALTQVVSAAFVTPFTSSVTSLQYLDPRMRKEAYDVELMQQAGITAS